MSEGQEKSSRMRGVIRVVVSVVVCLLILGVAGGVVYWINQTEPEAQRSGATRKSAALVETVVVDRGSHQPRLEVLGLVEPAREVQLSPRVSGQIIEVDSAFIPGGVVEQGQLLVTIDPADFENTLAMRQSNLRQVKADLAIEQGRQNVARQEFELLDQEIDADNRALVLREPQIEAIRARVQAAEASVSQARLDLERTKITAPFDAKILDRNVNVGSQVAAGDALAHMVGVDEYWVMATVPIRHLQRIRFPDGEAEGSAVTLRHPAAWGDDASRQGRVSRMVGQVDEQTRLARVLITVANPLAQESDQPALVLGTLLETEIQGQALDEVVRLNRDYIRQDESVWLMVDGKLQIAPVTIVFRDADYAYISEGLEDGDEVVTTSLSTVAEGLELRRIDESSNASDDASNGGGDE